MFNNFGDHFVNLALRCPNIQFATLKNKLYDTNEKAKNVK